MTSFNSAAPAAPATTETPAGTPAATAAPAPTQATTFEYNGRKFTPEEVINKLSHADSFIEQLKAERAEDRRLLTEATQALQQSVKAKELLTQPSPPAAPAAPEAPAFDVEGTVAKVIQANEVKRTQEANWTAAQEAMTAAYGDKADAKAAEVAKEVGMSVDALVALAKTSPAAFKRLFPELSSPQKPTVKPFANGSVNTTALPPHGDQKQSSGYWVAKKQKDQVAIYLNRLKELSN